MSKEVISKPLPDINEATKWRFWSKVTLQASPFKCWEYNGYKHRGYGKFSVTIGPQKDRPVIAPRLAYFLHHGIDPVGQAVLHKCDTPACCNPNHLFLGTNKDNSDDMHNKKRANPPKGDEHWGAKLTSEKVAEIRSRFANGTPKKDLEKQYSVDPGQMSRILNNKAWKHV